MRPDSFRFAVCMTSVIAIAVGLRAFAADEKGGYGSGAKAAEVRKAEGERLAAGVKIDTGKKPMPKDDLVVVITAHSQGGDPNHADGSFSLAKTGGGQTIHISGSRVYNVDAKLLGYGTTVSGKTWIYEVENLKVDGKKVFVAISSEYTGHELRLMHISLGEEAPADVGSFKSAGWAIAGRKNNP